MFADLLHSFLVDISHTPISPSIDSQIFIKMLTDVKYLIRAYEKRVNGVIPEGLYEIVGTQAITTYNDMTKQDDADNEFLSSQITCAFNDILVDVIPGFCYVNHYLPDDVIRMIASIQRLIKTLNNMTFTEEDLHVWAVTEYKKRMGLITVPPPEISPAEQAKKKLENELTRSIYDIVSTIEKIIPITPQLSAYRVALIGINCLVGKSDPGILNTALLYYQQTVLQIQKDLVAAKEKPAVLAYTPSNEVKERFIDYHKSQDSIFNIFGSDYYKAIELDAQAQCAIRKFEDQLHIIDDMYTDFGSQYMSSKKIDELLSHYTRIFQVYAQKATVQPPAWFFAAYASHLQPMTMSASDVTDSTTNTLHVSELSSTAPITTSVNSNSTSTSTSTSDAELDSLITNF